MSDRPGMSLWIRRGALLAFTIGVLVYRDAIIDDTFIHLQYARNLRQSHELAFNTGVPSQGATSPLWMLLLALTAVGETGARFGSVACGGLAVMVFSRLARRLLRRTSWAMAAAVAWGGSLWLVRHAPNGMETMAAVLFVLLAVDLRIRGSDPGFRDSLFGLVLACACLLRPEAFLLFAVFGIEDLTTTTGRRRLALWLPTWILPVGVWLGFARAQTGQLLPDTGSAKSGGLGPDPLVWAGVVWREIQILGAAHGVEMLGLLAAGGLVWRLDGIRGLAHRVAHPLRAYGIFSVLLLLLYALFDVQVQPRYLVLVTPFVVLSGFGAWSALVAGRDRVPALVCAAALGLGAVVSTTRVYPVTRELTRGLQEVLKPMAYDVAERDLDGVTLATPDIGVLGYWSGARILDLGGLIESRIQTLVREHGYDAMLRQGLFLDLGPVHFVLDRSTNRERFRDQVTRGLHWRVLRTASVSSLGLSRPDPHYYTLYVLEPAIASVQDTRRGPTTPGF